MRHPFSQLLKITGLPLVCVACFSLAGGHWMALQMFAWAQMLRDYSRNAPITEAIQKTFSGTAPCTMCKVIAEKQQREEKAPSIVKLDKKAEGFSLSMLDLLRGPEAKDFSYRPLGKMTCAKRCERRPLPESQMRSRVI